MDLKSDDLPPRDQSQGALEPTNNPLDIALDGKGFFAVNTPNGLAYTRKGSLHLDEKNRLVDRKGNPLQGSQGGDLVIPNGRGKTTIDPNGRVSVGKGIGNLPVGQLSIIDFVNGERLEKIGDGLFKPINKEDKGLEAKSTKVRQGFIEQSNVNSVHEMTKMIETVRTFETYQKVIQTIDGIEERSVNSLGRIG